MKAKELFEVIIEHLESVGADLNGTGPKSVPPKCDNHKEIQHRDGKAPWCNSCGWRHGVPSKPAVQVKVVD